MGKAKTMTAGLISGALVVALSGCSLLYPHWGATTFPSDTPSASQSPVPSSSASSSASPSASPSATPLKSASVQIMSATVNATGGVIDVIAQVTNVAEDGGQCILNVVSGATAKSFVVKAESNVDTTQCYPMELNIVGLQSGTAVVTVMYRSGTYLGTSPSQAVVIP